MAKLYLTVTDGNKNKDKSNSITDTDKASMNLVLTNQKDFLIDRGIAF